MEAGRISVGEERFEKYRPQQPQAKSGPRSLAASTQDAAIHDALARRFPRLDFRACLTCNLCASRCAMTGGDGSDMRKVLRLLALGRYQEVVDSRWPWMCTGCGRCAYVCPRGIDVVGLMKVLKGLRARDKVPGILHKGAQYALDKGNNMAIPKADYLFLMEDVGAEFAAECCPGFEVPIDREGADYLFYPNSKEVFAEPDDLKWWWKIFHTAGVSWTVPSENWESVDWGLFTGNEAISEELARRKCEHMERLKAKTLILPDCGGGSFGCRYNLEKHLRARMEEGGWNYVYLYEVLEKLINEGRLKLDGSRHPQLTTFHDSCKHGRECERVFGDKWDYDRPRRIIARCCDSYTDMYPNGPDSFCCGSGGGMWAGPYKEARLYYGRRKAESIALSGAKMVVTGCSNCRDQIMKALKPEYGLDIEVKYIWQLVADSLVMPQGPGGS